MESGISSHELKDTAVERDGSFRIRLIYSGQGGTLHFIGRFVDGAVMVSRSGE